MTSPSAIPLEVEIATAVPTAEQVAKLRGTVRRFIGARVRDPATADDLTQDVFLKVMRQLDDIRDPRRIMGWIFQIARHEVADHFRRMRPTEEFGAQHDDASPARPEMLEREEARLRDGLANYVRSVVHQLPPRYREALLLTDYEGLSQIELAAHIGLSVSAAKSRVQRARAMAKAVIDRCCHFDVDAYGRVVDCRSHACDCAAAPRRAHSRHKARRDARSVHSSNVST